MKGRYVALGALALVLIGIGLVWLRGGAREEGAVTTDVAVHVVPISRATVCRYVTAYGYVEPEPAHDGQPAAGAVLSPSAAGVLAEIDAVEGVHVDAGTVLFRLDSRLAEVAVQRARQEVDFAEKAFQRQQILLPRDGTSQRAYQEARQRLEDARSNLAAAQTQLSYMQVTAPLSGTIGQVDARLGQSIDANTVLGTIVDLDRLAVVADVPEHEASRLAVGQPVLLGSDSAAAQGSLFIVGRQLDPQTGTYRVHASVPKGAGYTPGQFTDIRIVVAEHTNVLVVPEAALVTREAEGSWIMVVRADEAVRTAVTPGIRDAGLVEVAGEGLEAGMPIVSQEAYSLPERTKIHVVEP